MSQKEALDKIAVNNGWPDWRSVNLSQESRDILFTMASDLRVKIETETLLKRIEELESTIDELNETRD